MKRYNKRTLIGKLSVALTAVLLLFSTAEAWAEIDTLSSAINKAGRQRMLTQRIVKAYLLVGMQVQTSRHKKQLADAVALFDAQLAELKAYSPNETITTSLTKVDGLWKPFKKLASGKVSRETANRLLETNDELLAAAHEVVGLLEQESTTSVGRLVNLSGRQRMLSQRLAKFYMARAWDIDRPEIVGEMQIAASQFDNALMTELFPAERNTPEIQAELNKAAKQWRVYERGLKLEQDSGDYIPVIMAVTSENLLKIMNAITGMYEDLSAN